MHRRCRSRAQSQVRARRHDAARPPHGRIHGTACDEAVDEQFHARAPGTALNLGYRGRIEATKGIEVLLDAAARLPPGSVRVLIAGKGDPDYTEALQRRYAGRDIVFLGFTRPAELFARIDLLVVPSISEAPLGRVIFEAYEHGVPSAVSRIGGMPEIVDEGRTGFVFEAGNAVALAALLAREHALDRSVARQFDTWRAAKQAASNPQRVA